MRTEQFSKARDFVEFFLHSPEFCARSLLDATMTGRCGYIFRGQRNVCWPLIPYAHREEVAWHRFTPQGPHRLPGDGTAVIPQQVNLAIGTQLHTELRSILLFLMAADAQGFSTPLNYDEFVGGHDAKLRPLMEASRVRRDPENPSVLITETEAEELAESLKEFPVRSTLPCFALAQHYGVPTRLLDWSESPFIAAYFAAAEAARGASLIADTFGVIALDTGRFKRDAPLQIVKVPRHSNPNLRAQRGVFTLLPDANHRYRQTRTWEALEERLGHSDAFVAATLPVSEARPLLQMLWRLDITADSLMPSLTAAAGRIRDLGEAFPTEPWQPT